MQQRGININMEGDSEDKTSAPLARGRTNSKLKVLVRSHAMREEASPPRDPPHLSFLSPCIKLIPSPNSSPSSSPTMSKPVVVLSPSISTGSSPCRSPQFVSPPSTSVPSISRSLSHEDMETVNVQTCNLEPEAGDSGYSEGCRSNSPKYSLSRSLEETSHSSNRRKGICDCTNQTCTNCLRSCERNFNNNLSSNINNNVVSSANTLTVNRGIKSKLRQQSSSQGSFEGSSSNSPCLSRESSSEQYTDTTGVDLEQFIAETLNRNGKDRALMLRIEQELVSLAKDKIKTHYKFPSMSSYQRMLVHRCAAYFGMDHNIESSGKCVLVNRTKNTRIPDIAFKEYIKPDIIFVEEPRRSILKRDSNSIEDYNFKSPDRQFSLENRRSKSFEEREEEYEKARRRIFNRELYSFRSTDEFDWSEVPWSSAESEYAARFGLLHSNRYPGRLLKVQSVEAASDITRPPGVAKSYSFGGYGGISVLTRGDSVLSTHSAGPRLLTKQDSGASTVSWRLSPSSSGYKSQSQISESITPSPTSTPNPSCDSTRQDSTNSNASTSTSEATDNQTDSQLVWAVTDIHDVPKGSIIINPQTGQPVKNIDGSIYHYDPHHLPPGFSEPECVPSYQSFLSHKLSPTKHRSKSSPTLNHNKKNSSTSPSLPLSPPPLQQSRSMHFSTSAESMPNLPPQQYHPVYGGSYGNLPTQDVSVPMYHQPYLVYATYGVPVQPQFEGRMESAVQEVPGSYFVADPSVNSGQPPVQCQAGSSYWNQQPLAMYQTAPTNPPLQPPPSLPQRYVVPVSAPPGTFLPQSFQPNYIHPSQNAQIIPPPQNNELQMYPQQPVQVIYPTSASQSNPIVYPNHGIVYTQNSPLYSNMMVPFHNVPYSTNPPSPTSCTPVGQIQEQLNQITISSSSQPNPSIAYNQLPPMGHSFDSRIHRSQMIKGNKFSAPKNMMSGSSQSSTGTSSPATTVIATNCNTQTTTPYRTPSATPPASNAFGYGPTFVPPTLHRQISHVHSSPPVCSRSPTPASDIEYNRFQMLPPTMFQGMPYVLQGDAQMIPGRGYPVNTRQPPIRHHSFNNPGIDNSNKTYKNRKPRTNKMPSVQLTGK